RTDRNQSAMTRSRGLVLLLLFSLALRLGLAPFIEFGEDSARLYDQALDFYLEGKIATQGALVVYSQSAIPGSELRPDFFVGYLPRGQPTQLGAGAERGETGGQ